MAKGKKAFPMNVTLIKGRSYSSVDFRIKSGETKVVSDPSLIERLKNNPNFRLSRAPVPASSKPAPPPPPPEPEEEEEELDEEEEEESEENDEEEEVEAEELTKEQLGEMSRNDLLVVAEERGVDVDPKAKKAAIIKALLENQG